MAANYMTEGRVALLDQLRIYDSANWRLGLFQNNIAVPITRVLADFTAATFSGYVPVQPIWNTAVPNSGLGRMDAPVLTFAHNGGGVSNTIYGYYLFHLTLGKVLFAELLATPKVMAAAGDVITIYAALSEAQG